MWVVAETGQQEGYQVAVQLNSIQATYPQDQRGSQCPLSRTNLYQVVILLGVDGLDDLPDNHRVPEEILAKSLAGLMAQFSRVPEFVTGRRVAMVAA
jgi:hypothetical protein